MSAFGLSICQKYRHLVCELRTSNLKIKFACRKKVLHIKKPQNVDCKTGIHNYVLTCVDLSRKQRKKLQYILPNSQWHSHWLLCTLFVPLPLVPLSFVRDLETRFNIPSLSGEQHAYTHTLHTPSPTPSSSCYL